MEQNIAWISHPIPKDFWQDLKHKRPAATGCARPYLMTRTLARSMVTADGGHQNEAEDDLLGEDRYAHEGHADAHDLNDQRADEGAPDGADAAGDGRAADHDAGDRRQKKFIGQRRRA